MFLLLAQQSISLCCHSLLLSLACGLGLGTLGVHLLLELGLTGLLGLGTVDLYNGLASLLSSRRGAIHDDRFHHGAAAEVDGENLHAQREHACA